MVSKLPGIVIISICLTACSDFLEVTPVGQTTIPLLFSDMEGIRAALPGAYSAMYDYYSADFYKYPEVAGNMVSLKTVTTDGDMVDEYNFISQPEDEAGAVGNIWTDIHVALANVNNIIQYQPSLIVKYPNNTDELNFIKAEALFLRALCHFDVCRVYAQPYNYTSDASHLGVPVLTKTPGADDNVGRSTVKEVYGQIIKDLNESIELFGRSSMKDAYHASKLASQALLCRVYLYMEDWENAVKHADIVLAEIPISNGDDYLNMFNKLVAGNEAIFRLNGTKKSSSLAKFYNFTNPFAIPADTLIKLFDDKTDLRYSLFGYKSGGNTELLILKYTITASVSEENKHYDPFILRASEMYLNRAEANLNLNQLSNGAADIKTLMARSLNKTVSQISIPETNKDSLIILLRKERAKELCFEGHQFFDITRWKQNLVRSSTSTSNVKFMSYPNDRFILPIPLKELEANKNMVGNPTVNY